MRICVCMNCGWFWFERHRPASCPSCGEAREHRLVAVYIPPGSPAWNKYVATVERLEKDRVARNQLSLL